MNEIGDAVNRLNELLIKQQKEHPELISRIHPADSSCGRFRVYKLKTINKYG